VTRINTNIPAITASRYLQINSNALARSLQRLTTGLRINRGADDPSGLIVSELLRADMASLGQAIDNSQRAINIVATAEGALNEVSVMLASIRELVVEAASSGRIEPAERRAGLCHFECGLRGDSEPGAVPGEHTCGPVHDADND